MYESFGTQGVNAVARRFAITRRLLTVQVSPTVILLGLTSLLTDISSEMISAVLPLYLVLHFGFTPLSFGLVDGLYHGVTALVRVAGGVIADRRRRYKEVAGFGYALSAACKLGLWSAGAAWLPTLGFLLLDRTGKGLRTAPRDALISLSSPPARLAEAFGVHRALDTAGAMLGPVVAFALLGLVPGAYDVIFMMSFCVAIVGLGILLFFVSNVSAQDDPGAPAVSVAKAFGLLGRPGVRGVVVAGGLLGVVTVSDAFVYLTFQRRALMDLQYFPLLFLGTATAYLLLAVPAGRLADWLGRRLLFVTGHIFLAGVYLVLLYGQPGVPALIACLALLGAYYATTDGVLMAIASSRLPGSLLTSGLALLTTVTALARLLASTAYGALWMWWGTDVTLAVFLLGLLVTIPGATFALGRVSTEVTT